MQNHHYYLVGNLGGTTFNLRLYQDNKIIREEDFKTQSFPYLEVPIQKFIRKTMIDKCCIAIAGPVISTGEYETVLMTNQHSSIEYNSADLSKCLGFPCKFINDFAAIGYYLTKERSDSEFVILQPQLFKRPQKTTMEIIDQKQSEMIASQQAASKDQNISTSPSPTQKIPDIKGDLHLNDLGGDHNLSTSAVSETKSVPFEGAKVISYLGACTGLGVGYLFRNRVFSSEGGHYRFVAENEFELEFSGYLRRFCRSLYHVSTERAVSGPGLKLLFQFVVKTNKTVQDVICANEYLKRILLPVVPKTILLQRYLPIKDLKDSDDLAKYISEMAIRGDQAMVAFMGLFFAWYGRFAGDIARQMSPETIYLTGGIIVKNLSLLQKPWIKYAFLSNFLEREVGVDLPIYNEEQEQSGSASARKSPDQESEKPSIPPNNQCYQGTTRYTTNQNEQVGLKVILNDNCGLEGCLQAIHILME